MAVAVPLFLLMLGSGGGSASSLYLKNDTGCEDFEVAIKTDIADCSLCSICCEGEDWCTSFLCASGLLTAPCVLLGNTSSSGSTVASGSLTEVPASDAGYECYTRRSDENTITLTTPVPTTSTTTSPTTSTTVSTTTSTTTSPTTSTTTSTTTSSTLSLTTSTTSSPTTTIDPACQSVASSTVYSLVAAIEFKIYCPMRPSGVVTGLGFDTTLDDIDHLLCVSYEGLLLEDTSIYTAKNEPCPPASVAIAMMSEDRNSVNNDLFDNPYSLALGCVEGVGACGWVVDPYTCTTVSVDAGGAPPTVPGVDMTGLNHWVVCPLDGLYGIVEVTRVSSTKGDLISIKCCLVYKTG